jgi:hypothetical protein
MCLKKLEKNWGQAFYATSEKTGGSDDIMKTQKPGHSRAFAREGREVGISHVAVF